MHLSASRVFQCLIVSTTIFYFFFFNDTATTEIYTLSLHDALPISPSSGLPPQASSTPSQCSISSSRHPMRIRSEEHTSELQSQSNLVCRLLLEKKKKLINRYQQCMKSHSE